MTLINIPGTDSIINVNPYTTLAGAALKALGIDLPGVGNILGGLGKSIFGGGSSESHPITFPAHVLPEDASEFVKKWVNPTLLGERYVGQYRDAGAMLEVGRPNLRKGLAGTISRLTTLLGTNHPLTQEVFDAMQGLHPNAPSSIQDAVNRVQKAIDVFTGAEAVVESVLSDIEKSSNARNQINDRLGMTFDQFKKELFESDGRISTPQGQEAIFNFGDLISADSTTPIDSTTPAAPDFVNNPPLPPSSGTGTGTGTGQGGSDGTNGSGLISDDLMPTPDVSFLQPNINQLLQIGEETIADIKKKHPGFPVAAVLTGLAGGIGSMMFPRGRSGNSGRASFPRLPDFGLGLNVSGSFGNQEVLSQGNVAKRGLFTPRFPETLPVILPKPREKSLIGFPQPLMASGLQPKRQKGLL